MQPLVDQKVMTGVPFRYMGTKRTLAPLVRAEIERLKPKGLIADPFTGMGSVVEALAPDFPVVMGDSQSFVAPLVRSRFVSQTALDIVAIEHDFLPTFKKRRKILHDVFCERLHTENLAMNEGPQGFRRYVTTVKHAGNSPRMRFLAEESCASHDGSRYKLVTLYFSGGYFGTSQAIELDAIRSCIDSFDGPRDQLLAAWLATAATIINSPGHAAQYLKPATEAAYKRTYRQWHRRAWPIFISKLPRFAPVGSKAWRQKNQFHVQDALDLLGDRTHPNIDVVYADPPYTKDQYSRFYHLYETLFRYDFPISKGAGRYRDGRFVSNFSLSTAVASAFEQLFDHVADRGAKLVLSYPEDGLLNRTSVNIEELLSNRFRVQKGHLIDCNHSTMGGSTGKRFSKAKERLFVCEPKKLGSRCSRSKTIATSVDKS